MDTEEALLKLGASKVHSVPNVTAALAILTGSATNVAVLDLNLGGETSAPLADNLKERGVPFLFATGYGDSVTIPSRFADVPVVPKTDYSRGLGDKTWLGVGGKDA